ncbi:MAG: hypothetical protein RLY16_2836, partial [Bacteroidota bacterium]
NGYVEFYGQMNDGSLDTRLYRYDSLQMNTQWSLYTDTAAYFLTINSVSANKRIQAIENPVAANTLLPEPYFIHSIQRFFKNQMNPGYGVDLGELVHSASYETGEGYSSTTIASGGTLTETNSSLQVYASGPTANFSATLAGNTAIARTVTIKLNNVTIATKLVTAFDIARIQVNNIALSAFAGDLGKVAFSHNGASDNIVVADYRIQYPRRFHFGNQNSFYFEMPASTAKYVEISSFAYGNTLPILYDIANGLRIVGDTLAGKVRFVLPEVINTRKMFLQSTAAGLLKSITRLQVRNFIDYGEAQYQGDYLMLTDSLLFNDGNGSNPVTAYQNYRSSAAGGGYNARVFDVQQLVDQFAFGVKQHPLAVRNFVAFAMANFSSQPRFLFLIGKGLKYTEYRRNEADPNIAKQALVPTFGDPASDNLLTASRLGYAPLLPVGRLSAITGDEVSIYLRKVQQFEAAQVNEDATLAGKGWMKNIAHITGGLADINLAAQIGSYMMDYDITVSDSLFGGKVYNFDKNSGLNTAQGTSKTLDALFSEGLSVLNYFGHSSPNSIEFNLDNPQSYSNTGRYPLMIINGCNSGDLFQFDTLRAISKGTLSEKFVLADQKGSIGYIASTHFGLPIQLNFFNTEFYHNFSRNLYGQTLGELMQASMLSMVNNYVPADYISQTHVEEITLHGDPALRINPHVQPDYVIEEDQVSFNPSPVSMADYSMEIKAKFFNIGKAIHDSFNVKIERITPTGDTTLIQQTRVQATLFEDSIVVQLALNPAIDSGTHQIKVSIDVANTIAEANENNNSITKSFTIVADEIRPIYPYTFAVVHQQNVTLVGSVANPLASVKTYVMEMDTTEKFNSPIKITRQVTDSGGAIRFKPQVNLQDSTVYYWRVAVGPVTAATHWLNSSFVYIAGGADGFNQSHYFQYKKNEEVGLAVDSNTYRFNFNPRTRKLLIRTGLYPYYDWDQINVNLDNEQLDEYGCRYRSIQIMVYDSLTMRPWVNTNSGSFGRFGSWPVCSGTSRNFFEFPYYDSSYRRKAAEFLQNIPNGLYVSITNLGWNFDNNYFIDKWKADTVNAGSGKSLWHRFHQLGLHKIDSFTRNVPFLFLFKKGDTTAFIPRQIVGEKDNSYIAASFFIEGQETAGTITSPWIGPAYNWGHFKWEEELPVSSATTYKHFEIIGRDLEGVESVLATVYQAKDTLIDFIDAFSYPYLKMRMYNEDIQNGKTAQLKYWMITSDNVPEGVVSPNMGYYCPDSLLVTDSLHLRVAFANVSDYAFDSIRVRLSITNQAGNVSWFYNKNNGARYQPANPGDSIILSFDIAMTDYFGDNLLQLEVNPNNDQPEWQHFNNYLFKKIYVGAAPVCPGSNAQFVIAGNHLTHSLQWQVNMGNGFEDLVNNSLYSGVQTDTLQIIAPPTNMYGNIYRCVIREGQQISYSNSYRLRFAVSWRGTLGTAWEESANWQCGVLPDANTDVTISPAAVEFPIIGEGVNAICRQLHLQRGATLKVSTGAHLIITG